MLKEEYGKNLKHNFRENSLYLIKIERMNTNDIKQLRLQADKLWFELTPKK